MVPNNALRLQKPWIISRRDKRARDKRGAPKTKQKTVPISAQLTALPSLRPHGLFREVASVGVSWGRYQSLLDARPIQTVTRKKGREARGHRLPADFWQAEMGWNNLDVVFPYERPPKRHTFLKHALMLSSWAQAHYQVHRPKRSNNSNFARNMKVAIWFHRLVYRITIIKNKNALFINIHWHCG